MRKTLYPWKCHVCLHHNEHKATTCTSCGAFRDGGVECSVCGVLNETGFTKCTVCFEPRDKPEGKNVIKLRECARIATHAFKKCTFVNIIEYIRTLLSFIIQYKRTFLSFLFVTICFIIYLIFFKSTILGMNLKVEDTLNCPM